jgi:hypothetical protein
LELARKLSKKESSGKRHQLEEQSQMPGEKKQVHQKVADLENVVSQNEEYALLLNSLEAMMMERA